MSFSFGNKKARIRWLTDGDANNKYFHSVVKGRRSHLGIQQIYTSDGILCDSQESIQDEAVSFYTSLFAKEPTGDYDLILQHIPPLITEDDNLHMTQILQATEIKEEVWQLDPHSAAGPDGYHGNFFRSYWSIIQTDVVIAVQEFFIGIPQPSIMAGALLTLLPKGASPHTFCDFRPICLTNFISKVCTRIIATRLGTLLPATIALDCQILPFGNLFAGLMHSARRIVNMMERC